MSRDRSLTWLPPAAVGFASAVAAEVSTGLLLYTGLGLLRALTLILTVLLGALALGLWTVPRDRPYGEVLPAEVARRRWILVLLAYSAAALTAAVWGVMGGLSGGLLTRGLGLALLAGLPLYGSGAVLGAVASSYRGTSWRVGAPALAGAALGAALTGLVFVPVLVPGSIYVLCLVALSGGALAHGRVLDRAPEEELGDGEPSELEGMEPPELEGMERLEVVGPLESAEETSP